MSKRWISLKKIHDRKVKYLNKQKSIKHFNIPRGTKLCLFYLNSMRILFYCIVIKIIIIIYCWKKSIWFSVVLQRIIKYYHWAQLNIEVSSVKISSLLYLNFTVKIPFKQQSIPIEMKEHIEWCVATSIKELFLVVL